MGRYRVWCFWLVLFGCIVTVTLVVGFYGTGRWWFRASAKEIRSVILRRLNSSLAYQQFVRDLRRRESVSPAIDIWLPSETTAAASDSAVREVGGDDLKSAVRQITHAQGAIRDGHYRVSVIARTEHHRVPFQQPVKLADRIGDVAFTIHNGRLQTCSLVLGDLSKISQLRERFVTVVASLGGTVLPPHYREASLQLLDGRACSYRTARHIERLYSSVAKWPDVITDRLIHVGLMTSLQKPPSYYRPDHFTLMSAEILGVPQAFIQGELACRVCVLATTTNTFGEAFDAKQTILAVEQSNTGQVVVRDVLRIEAVEFNADLINGLLTGRIANPLLGYVALTIIIVVVAIIVRYVLAVCIQIKTLTTSASRNIAVSLTGNGGKPDATRQDDEDTE